MRIHKDYIELCMAHDMIKERIPVPVAPYYIIEPTAEIAAAYSGLM